MRAVLDDLLEDVGHKGGLLASVGVLVPDDGLVDEIVQIVFFLELLVVYFGLDVGGILKSVVQFVGECLHGILEGDAWILGFDDYLARPDGIFPIDRSLHFVLDILYQQVCAFVPVQDDVDLSGYRFIVYAELIYNCLNPLSFPPLRIPALEHGQKTLLFLQFLPHHLLLHLPFLTLVKNTLITYPVSHHHYRTTRAMLTHHSQCN